MIQTPKILRLIEVYGEQEGQDIPFDEEFNTLQHDRGMVSMARSLMM